MNRLPDLLDAAAATPDAIALIDGDRCVTYETLSRLTNQAARAFSARGVGVGDRVIVALENGVEMVAAYFGAMLAGAVAVPLPPGPRSDRLAAAIADCTPQAAVVDDATARHPATRGLLAAVPVVLTLEPASGEPAGAGFRAALAAVDDAPVPPLGIDTSLAAIIYTSGSTGRPRGVMLTHRNFVSNAEAIISYLRLTAADRVMCVLPFTYVYGLSLLHTHVAVGGSVVLENRAAFPNVVLRGMQVHHVTGFAGVPSTFAMMLHRSNLADTPLPDLRYVTQAGGAMPPARIREWLAKGPRADFYVMYGATEAAARLTYLPPADLPRKLGSIGRAVPGVVIRVVDDQGDDVTAPGGVGELLASGPNISPGYWGMADETAERFSPEGYRTGDLGYADDEGFLFITGRRHDMMKVGANRVGAREIEDVLLEHPAVSEAVVVGAPDDLLGEVPVAFVTLRAALPDPVTTLRGHVAATSAPYKVPVEVTVLPDLPRLSTGKPDRMQLQARGRGKRPAPHAPRVR